MPVGQNKRADVIEIVNAVAVEAPTAASKVRSLIRRSIDWARAQDESIGANPADSGIDASLDFGGHRATHHRVLPAEEIAKALAVVDASSFPTVALCLRFLTLTVARSAEATGARWSEIDGDVWTIPAERMKMGREHRVPLSTQALEVLAEARQLDDGSGFVFPSRYPTGGSLSTVSVRRTMATCQIEGTPTA